MNSDNIDFVTYCIGNLSRRLGLNARRPVTEKTALLFEAALGVNAEPLLKMQMRYNLQSTKSDSTFMTRLAKVRRVAAAL